MSPLPDGVILRDMTEADVPAVHALERVLFPMDAWPERMFRDELSQPETRRYYVVEESAGHRIVAYAGVMCVPPIDEEAALHFALLREIARRNELDVLSMGMSADFEKAIRFGATHVRVGTAIFGARGAAFG